MSTSAATGAGSTGSAPARVTITRKRGPSRGIRYSQRALMGLGLVLLAWGTYVMIDTVNLTRISGVALWQRGGGPFLPVPVGQAVHHPSWMPHAMAVGAAPLAALYLWRGGDLAAKSVIVGR